jgi:integrase
VSSLPGGREGRDRLEILAALLNAPSVDPLFRAEVIKIPAGHPVYRWYCLVAGCERPKKSGGDLCSAHLDQWRDRQRGGAQSKGDFMRTASPAGPASWRGERPCRICPQRPARCVTLVLCGRHQDRWWRERHARGAGADFDRWLAGQEPYPGFGDCRVAVCPELASSPLGLCALHEGCYRRLGRPGGAALPAQWATRYERTGRVVPVGYADEAAFRAWCASAPPVASAAQVNLRGLPALLRAELQWGLWAHTQEAHSHWELPWVQDLANYCRARGLRSLTELDVGGEGFRRAVGREVPMVAAEILRGLGVLYATPEATREQGYILTEHFGRRLPGRSGRIDLAGVSQPWLRGLLWDHFAGLLRSPRCPRSACPFDDMRRAGLELSAFLEIHAPGGGHDPTALTGWHMQQFAADQHRRELDGLPSLGFQGRHGRPSIVTANTRQAVFLSTRRLLREALDSGAAEQLGLPRDFATAMPPPGKVAYRARAPFPDEVARALADEANLATLAEVYDPCDRGLRDAWETIVATGRRCSEVLNLRLDCLGRYGGLPMLWHDQTKVGNYGQALRIPERIHQLLEARQRKTVAAFTTRHDRPPTAAERAQLALFPTNLHNRDGRRALSYKWFHRGFKGWVDGLDIGAWVPHQARHSLATGLLRAGASLTHIRRYLGQVSERMAEHYVHLTQSDLDDVLARVWVTGPGTANPGELLTGDTVPLTREQAAALAVDLSRRSTPAEGGFCTFQPVVDGGACPWGLDCHNCDKFVLSGADLLYWRRKREQWRLLAEGAPDDATADYLHRYFEPTARAIDGLEKALAGLGLLDDALALDLRRPQDYFHRVWSTAFRAADLAQAAHGEEEMDGYGGGDGVVSGLGDGGLPEAACA